MEYLKITLAICFAIVLIGSVGLYNYKKDIITSGNLEIDSGNLKSISDEMPEGYFQVCSIKDKECGIFLKRNLPKGG